LRKGDSSEGGLETRPFSLIHEKPLGKERRFSYEAMAMRCPSCGTENPDGARFCQMCGRLVAPGSEYQQVTKQRIVESPLARPSYRDRTKKKSGLVLATILIAAGAGAIGLSSLVTSDLHGRSPEIRDLFLSAVFQAYVVAAAGVGMMIYHMLPRPVEGVPLLHRMDSPIVSRAGYGFPQSRVVAERRLGTGIRTLLYFFSILSPLVGSIAGAILYTREEPDYEHVGKMCIVLTVVILVVGAIVGAMLYFAFGVPSGTG
jgi:uncharacterized OB-fold protein